MPKLSAEEYEKLLNSSSKLNTATNNAVNSGAQKVTQDGIDKAAAERNAQAVKNGSENLTKKVAAQQVVNDIIFETRIERRQSEAAEGFADRVQRYGGAQDNLLSAQKEFREEAAKYRKTRHYYQNRRLSIGNAQAQADFGSVGVSGFNVDLSDDAIRASFVQGQFAQDNLELQAGALAIVAGAVGLVVASPLIYSAGVGAVGWSARGIQVASGSVASFGADWSAFGLANAIGLRAPTAAIYGAELLAGLSEGGIYAASFGTVATGATRYGDDIVDAVGFGNRTQLSLSSPSEFARSLQGSFDYPGRDVFRDITLKKGKIIYGGTPGQSEFYTTFSGVKRSGFSSERLFKGLQVGPGDPNRVPTHPVTGLYRPEITAYEVLQDIPAAFGRTLANPHHGPGKFPQIVVEDFQKYLRPIETIPLQR